MQNRYQVASGVLLCISNLIALCLNAEDFADQLPRIPPTSPQEALKAFDVADGYEMQLVAAEPLIGSPVAIEWNAKGQMYVCEMRGYSEDRDDKISSIALLTDTDDDGVYDHRCEYAKDLYWPTAIFPFDGGLFVGDAPDLLYLKDTDGDGVADTRQTVLTGFGVSNVQGLMNSMRWGLDNRIHIACSSVGGQIKIPGSDQKPVNIRGRDLSFDPRTFQFTPTSGAAQHGMCFDDWGRKFASSNSNHIMQVMFDDDRIARNPFVNAPSARVSIAVDGPQAEVFRTSPVEPWRIVRTRLRVSGKVSGPIEGGGRAAGYFTGATGITIYRGDAWPTKDKGIAIVGDVGSNLIHRKRLKPNGLEFKAHRIDPKSEFVTSTDIWFRPAQFANAPDGSLHVIDVCREVIEHPKSLPPDIKQHLDLTAGRDRGRVYRIVPKNFRHRATPNLVNAKTLTLISLLGHPNAWHRETASRLLYQYQDRLAIGPLLKLATQTDKPLATLHAMYVLSGMDELPSSTFAKALSVALEHPHEQIRRHAVRLADQPELTKMLGAKIIALANDPSLAVRTEVAYALANVKHPKRNQALADIIRRDRRIWTQIAVQSSAATSAAELFSVLLIDQEFRDVGAIDFLSNLARQLSQRDVRGELWMAMNAIELIPENESAFVLPILGELLAKRGASEGSLADLATEGYLDDIDDRKEKMIQSALQVAVDVNSSVEQRTASIHSLRYSTYDSVGQKLAALIEWEQPLKVQQAAMLVLSRFENLAVASTLLDAWPNLSPGLRTVATECLLARPERTLAMFDAVDERRLKISDLPRARLSLLAKSKNPDIAVRAKKYASAKGGDGREKTVKAYKEALHIKSDVSRGRSVFKKRCASCHKIGDVGHELGPNLAAMKSRGAEAILVNVLDPSREVNPEYLNYAVVTIDGRTVTGMITSETANSITLSRGEGTTDVISRGEIELLQSTGISIMPEGIEESIDVQAMADLIAFLMQAE